MGVCERARTTAARARTLAGKRALLRSGSEFDRIALLYRGFVSRVADNLGVSPSMVRQVLHGSKTSARISKAIDREIARVEREIERDRREAA
jgi:hypothetical protein